MTQAELWQLHLMAASNTSEAFQGVVTIIFAFLATAYFVGRRLTRAQAILASLFFVYSAASTAIVEFRRAAMFMERLTAEYGVSSISPNAFVVPASALLLALLIVASVAFLFQVRRPRRRHVSSSQPSETR
jgi:cobalamin synthase